MKFIVRRTSSPFYWDTEGLMENKPCDEAVWEAHVWSDGIERESWYIEINTLEQLVAFCEKYREIVFNGEEIEIYDDYRE